METREQIGKWYDEFAEKQVKTNVNLRHYKIMDLLLRAGLKNNSSVLEIGCGIGTLTGLLLKYLKRGEVVATDISPESVRIAEKRLASAKNMRFMVTDMTDFSYPAKFDFVVLPDVLEHIPVARHEGLFKILTDHMHDRSVILINIPHPKALDYIREHNPAGLQIIDQSVSADTLLNNAYANDLILISYNSYSLYDRANDYAVIVFGKNRAVSMSPLPVLSVIVRKFILRCRFFLARF